MSLCVLGGIACICGGEFLFMVLNECVVDSALGLCWMVWDGV